ncbi:STAS domain-containing protein [Streptomyces xanthophaeus]|uniref:STAS domain-containing protein n=1 Tax=Streptomyces xanthophaeus TaxID=67385 RepID=UPI003F4CC6A5
MVVDCSRLTFCDSSGLNTLLAIRRTAHESRTSNSLLRRLLEMTGTLTLFPVDHDPPAAS